MGQRNQLTLPCEQCPRRIAWWSADLERRQWASFATGDPRPHHWAPVGQGLGWAWQGQWKNPPIRWRETPTGREIDVRCGSCGWTRTYPTERALVDQMEVR